MSSVQGQFVQQSKYVLTYIGYERGPLSHIQPRKALPHPETVLVMPCCDATKNTLSRLFGR